MHRTYALKLAYEGGAFRGWQRQPGMVTVQDAVESALGELLGKRPLLHGASRTDAGVHAEGQVASFQSGRSPDPALLVLPPGVRCLAFVAAADSFHARSSSTGKRYRYRYAWGPGRPERTFWLGGEARPDWARARDALELLADLPRLDGLCSPSPLRKTAPPLSRWSLDDEGLLRVEGKAFRKHQIRNLAGHLAAIALGLAAPGSLRELAARSRPWMGATAPPHGLTLEKVFYPPELDPFEST